MALSFLFLSLTLLSSFFFLSLPPTRTRKGSATKKKMTKPTSSKRAKYLTSSSPHSKLELPGYSFCESAHATSHSRWHIRALDAAGKKLGGGITTPSLCGLVTRGWDLNVDITSFHLERACPRCVAKLKEQTEA